MTTATIPNVTLTTQANVYFDGKCVSHGFIRLNALRMRIAANAKARRG